MEAFYKKEQSDTFLRVFKWEKIDLCKLAADSKSYSPIREQLDNFNKTVRGMFHKCPYKDFDIDGMTLSLGGDTDMTKVTNFYPNGFIKVAFVFTNRNKFAAALQFFITKHYE